ncbi:MAG: transcription termination/antitermination NusG family protein [Verrucomicrobiota bacterium]
MEPDSLCSNSIDSDLAWFCLRAQTKREHIAGKILSNNDKIEVFCPRLSQVRKTKTGKKRFVEAMFPGYLFARFSITRHYRWVMHSQGITNIVENGERRPIPEHIIEELKQSLPDEITESPDLSLEPGARIDVVSGSLKGLNGRVLAQLPAMNRVQVLLDFLGRELTVAVEQDDVLLAKQMN